MSISCPTRCEVRPLWPLWTNSPLDTLSSSLPPFLLSFTIFCVCLSSAVVSVSTEGWGSCVPTGEVLVGSGTIPRWWLAFRLERTCSATIWAMEFTPLSVRPHLDHAAESLSRIRQQVSSARRSSPSTVLPIPFSWAANPWYSFPKYTTWTKNWIRKSMWCGMGVLWVGEGGSGYASESNVGWVIWANEKRERNTFNAICRVLCLLQSNCDRCFPFCFFRLRCLSMSLAAFDFLFVLGWVCILWFMLCEAVGLWSSSSFSTTVCFEESGLFFWECSRGTELGFPAPIRGFEPAAASL